jgi:hypothetical protein
MEKATGYHSAANTYFWLEMMAYDILPSDIFLVSPAFALIIQLLWQREVFVGDECFLIASWCRIIAGIISTNRECLISVVGLFSCNIKRHFFPYFEMI